MKILFDASTPARSPGSCEGMKWCGRMNWVAGTASESVQFGRGDLPRTFPLIFARLGDGSLTRPRHELRHGRALLATFAA